MKDTNKGNTNSNTTEAVKAEKKEAYVSMDREERDLLRTLGLRERSLYAELKWLASFKTGAVQHFGKRVVTYQFLADLITVPTTQGRAADTMNAKEACRVLMKLHEAGLVGEIENHPRKGLQFALPLSPICKKTALKMRQVAKAEEQKYAEKLSNEALLEFLENPIATQPGGEFNPALSVMKISKGDQYDFHTDIISLAAAYGTAAARDAIAGPFLKNFLEPKSSEPNETSGATADTLTIEVIKERLRRSKSEFSWIDNTESAAMYRRWIAAKHSPEKFEEAVRAVEADFSNEPNPRAIDGELRGGGASRRDAMLRAEQKAKRRGGVAL